MVTKLPLNPKTEIFRWGPIPGRFFYTSVFTEVNYKYFCQKYLGNNWSPTLFLFKNGRMIWINEYAGLRASGRPVFVKYLLPDKTRQKGYTAWKKDVRVLTRFEGALDKIKLKKTSNQRLLALWNKFHEYYLNFWVTGTVPELGNYGADELFEKKLRKYIKEERALNEAIEVLTAPERMSFYQEEEIALSRAKNLSKHQQKYFWLKNSYFKTEILPVSFFAQRKKQLSPNLPQEITIKIKQIKQNKLTFKNKYNLSATVMSMADAISEAIAWQDERKKYIFIALHYQHLMLKEITRRFKYNYQDLLNFWFWEIANILKGKNYHQEILHRRGGCGVFFYKNGCENLSSALVNKYWLIYGEEKINLNLSAIKGLVVSRGAGGKIQGRVRILLDPSKVGAFKKGEILLAPMTSPEYIFAMRKAAAIITDAGGLTCHATIVSRELGIPCVVGTKIATKVFKTGDLIDINVRDGLVKKVK